MALKLERFTKFSGTKFAKTLIDSNRTVAYIFFLCLVISWNTSCGVATPAANASPGPNQGSPVKPVSSIAIFPTGTTLAAGESLQFTASVNDLGSTAVTWSASAGTVSGGGLFTAPSVSSEEHAVVTVTSTVDPG